MDQELIIGKYTLESLTNGMYASPLDLYREYIQNAVDSIDLTIQSGIENSEKLKIEIFIKAEENTIIIRDNGRGLKKDNAVATLIDIGNSRKERGINRGFRGIGRLSGLGYCDSLIFETSAIGENEKTVVKFNAKLLRQLLLSKNDNESLTDVLKKIISVEHLLEKNSKHYFEVKLIGTNLKDRLMDLDVVRNYIEQHAPLPFSPDFKWGKTVQEKVRLTGYSIPDYKISINDISLYKPYSDKFISDRIRKTEDAISDIHVHPFYRDGKLSAVLWYAQTDFNGTINDNAIKGVRIRQGNILIGDRTSCNEFFKEDRFNGWLIGELHALDSELIANARRDNFEKNEVYYSLIDEFRTWAFSVSKEIRHVSYERSLTREKKAVAEAETYEDINDLYSEDLYFADPAAEGDSLSRSDSDLIAETDYFDKLFVFLGQKKNQTKYKALNINEKLTTDQRKVLERVFDLIQQEYDEKTAESFINYISKKF